VSHIICVHSFRHGTGKSSLTANLAVCLARPGRRVGIIDTDFQAPGIHSLFELDPDHLDPALNYYLWSNMDLVDVAQSTDLWCQVGDGKIILMGGGIYLVPDSLKLSEMTRLLNQGYDVTRLQQGILDVIQRLQLDFLVIDSHPTWDEGALATMGMVDVAIVLMCLDRQDFQGTAVALDITANLEVPHTLLVVNQVLSSYDPQAVREQLMAAYDITEVTLLPLSLKMALLGGQGIFCLKYPQDELALKIDEIAQTVVQRVQQQQPKFQRASQMLPSPEPSPTPAVESGFRLFELLKMPHEQRQLMRWLMRHPPVSFAAIAAYAAQTWNQSEAETQALLDILVQQHYVTQVADDSPTASPSYPEALYRVNLATKPGQPGIAQLWSKLEAE